MAMVFINKAILMQYAHSMTLLTLQVLIYRSFGLFLSRRVYLLLIWDLALCLTVAATGYYCAYTLRTTNGIHKS